MRRDILAVGIAIILGLTVPLFIRSYWLHVAIIALYYALLASSWTMLAGFVGQFSFATMALAGIGAYTSALLVIKIHLPMWVGIISGALTATSVGLIIGVLVLRMSGPYLALFTIAFSELVRITLNAEYQLTRGDMGLTVPRLYLTVSKIPYYYTIFGLLVVSLLTMWAILRSRYGLFFRAIREHEQAASAMGVNIVRYKIMSFVVSSFFAGLAGGFFAHYVGTLTPNSIMEIPRMGLVIAMSVIGGIESLVGAVVGAIIVEFLQEYLRALEMWRFVIFGLALVFILRFSQNGLIYPIYERLAGRRVELRTESEFESNEAKMSGAES
ncbi:MAG: branched-chain amino acid ABC transporter permease [Proteobacteria bacterium]|nr:branched-chain amino acid ABC transporter permease [Pseudomonadota bacterium]